MKPDKIAFIERSFRDVADQDYVLARIAYRYDLRLQFVWLAQQAAEKYLKALLLYNGRSAKRFRHSVVPAYDEVLRIHDIPFEFPASTRNFMQYLDDRASRYFEYSFYVTTKTLVALDRTVWFLRRYCEYIRGTTHDTDGQVVDRLQREIQWRGNALYLTKPYRFTMFHGYLESVLRDRSCKLRPFLTWSNLYFARRRRTSPDASRGFSTNSAIALDPSLVAELDSDVHFSKELKRRMEKWASEEEP